jgi:hypothetical protein
VPFQKVLDYCETHHQVNGVHEVSAKDNNGIFFFYINIYIFKVLFCHPHSLNRNR